MAIAIISHVSVMDIFCIVTLPINIPQCSLYNSAFYVIHFLNRFQVEENTLDHTFTGCHASTSMVAHNSRLHLKYNLEGQTNNQIKACSVNVAIEWFCLPGCNRGVGKSAWYRE